MPSKFFDLLKHAAATRDAGCSWTDVGDRPARQDAAGHEKTQTAAAQPSVSCNKATPADSAISLADNEIVSWKDADPEDPRNWSSGAKWTVTLLMSSYSLVTLISSSMIAPALPTIAAEINTTSEVEIQIVFSAFILACAVGSVVFAPLSEIYGRKILVLSGNAFYIVWTVVCGFATTKAVMIVGRFMSGFGASVVFGVGPTMVAAFVANISQVQSGLLSDCWRAEERGKSLAILNFAPLLGPALGPIFGGFIVQNTTWRWIFWSIAIFDGVLQIYSMFFFWETYGPVLLGRRAALLRKRTGNPNIRTVYDCHDRRPGRHLYRSLMRPLIIMGKHPAAQILTLYGCVGFGTLYIMLSDFATHWMDLYHQPASISGLHYLALVIGFTIGSQGCSYLMDRLWRRVSLTKTPTPEIRTVFLWPGTVCWVVGLLIYGWGAQQRVHWIVPDIGAAIFGLGAQLGTSSIGAYLTDTYGIYTASASAGSFALRSLCAFAFPLFAPYLYQSLGYGWGNTLLACICAVFGLVIPALIWKYGPEWRERAKLEELA